MRQSDAVTDVDTAAATSDAVQTVDTVSLPDVNTGLPTVCSSASIASSTGTTDNECESFSCVELFNVSVHFVVIACTVF